MLLVAAAVGGPLLKLFIVGCDPDDELLDCLRLLKLTRDADAGLEDESPLDVDIAELE
jgi:hypothetical protein